MKTQMQHKLQVGTMVGTVAGTVVGTVWAPSGHRKPCPAAYPQSRRYTHGHAAVQASRAAPPSCVALFCICMPRKDVGRYIEVLLVATGVNISAHMLIHARRGCASGCAEPLPPQKTKNVLLPIIFVFCPFPGAMHQNSDLAWTLTMNAAMV